MAKGHRLEATLIDASPHKGTSWRITRRLQKGLEDNGFNTELLEVYCLKIGECLGCFSKSPDMCTYPCVVADDMDKVYNALTRSHAAVFVFPTYWANVPGKLKNLVDRLTSLENNGYLMEGIVAAVVAVNQVGGGWEAASWLAATLNMMGAIIPPYAVQVHYSSRVQRTLRERLGASANEYWGERDLDWLAHNIAHLCQLGLRGHHFGFRATRPHSDGERPPRTL
jgi:multimeric flavodoxin WrbA